MRVEVRGPVAQTVRVLMGRCGYHAEVGYRGGEAYARRIGSLPFPRFHAYVIASTPHRLVLRVHLDQKRPSYVGSHAHAAEYDGSALQAEAARLRQCLRGHGLS